MQVSLKGQVKSETRRLSSKVSCMGDICVRAEPKHKMPQSGAVKRDTGMRKANKLSKGLDMALRAEEEVQVSQEWAWWSIAPN